MSIFNVRALEPLYIIIFRGNDAETVLKAWVKEHKVEHVQVTGNRMMVHHRLAYDRFVMTWPHDWELVTIWDTWNRRHIYL